MISMRPADAADRSYDNSPNGVIINIIVHGQLQLHTPRGGRVSSAGLYDVLKSIDETSKFIYTFITGVCVYNMNLQLGGGTLDFH